MKKKIYYIQTNKTPEIDFNKMEISDSPEFKVIVKWQMLTEIR